jgi:Rhs element Vgr protein
MSANILTSENGPISFEILINGSAIPSTSEVISIDVKTEINHIPSANLVLNEGSPNYTTPLLSESDDFVPGNKIEVRLGYDAKNERVFKGIITKIAVKMGSRRTVLILEAKSEAIKMTMGKNSRCFYDTKDSEAIKQVVQDNGLAIKSQDTAVTYPDIIQYQSTDWDFVLSKAKANGHLCWIKGDTLITRQPKLNRPSLFTLQRGLNVISFKASIDAIDQLKTVSAQQWDISAQDITRADATEPPFDTSGNLPARQLAEVFSADKLLTSHANVNEPVALQALADGELTFSRLAKIQGSVSISGHANIAPTHIITLDGFGNRFDGDVFVSSVSHELESGNWITHIGFGLPQLSYQDIPDEDTTALNEAFAVAGLQIGLVKQLENDPQGEERILVHLPMTNSNEHYIWARLANIDAGKNRGTVFRPEIGDEVVVGFINSNANNAVILGSLSSSAKPSPIAASDDNHEKGIVTRSNMKIIFNDEDESISIKNNNDNRILLSDSGIEWADNNGNKIVMNANGIEISSDKNIVINANKDIKTDSLNLTMNSNANAEISSQANASLCSSGRTVVKGSLVQIN